MPTSIETRLKLLNLYSDTKKSNSPSIREIGDEFLINFINGASAEVKGYSKNMYRIQFIDIDTNYIVFESSISPGHWCKPARLWYTNWKIKIINELTGNVVSEHTFNAQGQRVYIAIDSKSLGDTLAWFPYVEEFRKKHKCQIICSTFWNDLFKKTYKDIEFVEPGVTVHNLYAMYTIGIFESNNTNHHKNDTRSIPLQQVASDFIGINFTEIRPKIYIENSDRNIFGRYACIATESTAQAKYWNNPTGWQYVVDYLNKNNTKPVVIQKGKTDLRNIDDKTGDLNIQERITQLVHCDFFIGIGSGLSWLAWALGKPVILISGFSKAFCEFQLDCYRIIDESICNGCFNDTSIVFDKGDWNWCPRLKGTKRQFECTRQIDSSKVIYQIDKLQGESEEKKFYTHEYPDKPMYLPSTLKPDTHWKDQEIKSVLPYHEIFEMREYEYGGCYIEPGDVVLDIGAHIGVFSRYAFLKKASKVVAAEPAVDNFEICKKNYSLYSPDEIEYKLYQAAISDIDGEKDLLFDSHHIHTLSYKSDTHTGEKYKVKSITLNTLIQMENLEKIDYVKLDIEGSEVEALKGISDTNLMKIRKFCMEYHHFAYNHNESLKQDVIDRFARLGFKYYIRGFVNTNDVYIMHFWR